MSLYANIDHLSAASGVIALSVDSPDKERLFRGLERWRPVLDGAVKLLEMTGETSIRLVVGEHTMVVQHELKETVAVVIPTGHAIAKSLRRMIRRMARKVRAPYTPPAPQLQQPAAQGTTEPVSRAPSQPQVAPQTRGPGIPGQHGTAQPAAPSKPLSNGWGDRFSS